MGRDSLSVWTVNPTDESRYQERVRSYRADSNLANITFRCSETEGFWDVWLSRISFWPKLGGGLLKQSPMNGFFVWTGKWWQELQWIWEAENHLKLLKRLLPRTGAGAFPVHDSASTGSWAVGPLRPCWPLAMDSLGSVLAKFDALTPPTPLEKCISSVREDAQKQSL